MYLLMYTVTIYFIQFALIGIGLILPLVYFSMNQSDINKSCLVCIIIALCHKYMIYVCRVNFIFHTAAQSQCLLRVPSYKFSWSHVRNYAAQLSLYVARQCWARRTQHRQQQFFGALEKKEILGFLTFQRLIYI